MPEVARNDDVEVEVSKGRQGKKTKKKKNKKRRELKGIDTT